MFQLLKSHICKQSLLIIVILNFGCQSRFHEPDPKSVPASSKTTTENLTDKALLDKRLSEVQRSFQRIQFYLNAINDALPKELGKSKSPTEILMAANEKAKDSLPMRRANGLVRTVRLEIADEQVSSDCRKIEVEIRSLSQDKGSDKRLEYAVRTCSTQNTFVPIVQAQWANKFLDIQFANKEITEKIFAGLFVQKLTATTECKVSDPNSSDANVECSDFVLNLGTKHSLILRKFSLYTNEQLKLNVEYEIFENEIIRYQGFLKIFAGGKQETGFNEVR